MTCIKKNDHTSILVDFKFQFQITVHELMQCSVAFLIPQILIVNGVCQGKFHSCLFKPCFPIFHQQFASGSTLVIPWHLLPANCQLEMFMEPLIYRFGAGAPECLMPHQFLADTITQFHSGGTKGVRLHSWFLDVYCPPIANWKCSWSP